MKVQHIKSIALFQKRELIYVKLKYKYDIEISIIRSYTKSTIHMNITINNKLIVGDSSQTVGHWFYIIDDKGNKIYQYNMTENNPLMKELKYYKEYYKK